MGLLNFQTFLFVCSFLNIKWVPQCWSLLRGACWAWGGLCGKWAIYGLFEEGSEKRSRREGEEKEKEKVKEKRKKKDNEKTFF